MKKDKMLIYNRVGTAEQINHEPDTDNIIEKYFDLTEYGAEQDIKKYLAAGWKIVHRGLTLIIMQKEINGG